MSIISRFDRTISTSQPRCGGMAVRPLGVAVLQAEGPLRAPMRPTLRRDLQRLLDRGERTILLDLSRVPEVDAAGVGELVHAYNMTAAANGVLRVERAVRKVEALLDRAGLRDILGGEGYPAPVTCAVACEA